MSEVAGTRVAAARETAVERGKGAEMGMAKPWSVWTGSCSASGHANSQRATVTLVLVR